MCDRNDLLALMLQWRSEIGSADRLASSGLFSERLGNPRLGGVRAIFELRSGEYAFSAPWMRSHIAVGALVYWQRKTTFWLTSTSRSLVRMVCVARNPLVEER